MEMDLQHRERIQSLTNQSNDKDVQIRQLRLDLLQQQSLPVS